MKKTVKLIKKIKFVHNTDYTYPGLVHWYHSMFETLGWMILAKDHGFEDKIATYKKSIQRLKEGIEKKLREIENNDKRQDLEIMLRNVELLINHTHKDFA